MRAVGRPAGSGSIRALPFTVVTLSVDGPTLSLPVDPYSLFRWDLAQSCWAWREGRNGCLFAAYSMFVSFLLFHAWSEERVKVFLPAGVKFSMSESEGMSAMFGAVRQASGS